MQIIVKKIKLGSKQIRINNKKCFIKKWAYILGIYPKEHKSGYNRGTFTPMFILAYSQ
jgi:hypothetical protein